MTQLIVFPVLLITLMLGTPASAGDYWKGWYAARRGDHTTALREWEPLAEQGNAYAQFFLGVMYKEGKGVTQNYETAVKWYRLAAEQGFADAQNNLGFMYGNGKGVPQDYETAAKWYRLSAEQGYAPSQTLLSEMYFEGEGVTRDYTLAHMWLNLAASQGNEGAIKGRDIVEGRMTPANISNARKLARECVKKKYEGC